jgi:hypothetical protein
VLTNCAVQDSHAVSMRLTLPRNSNRAGKGNCVFWTSFPFLQSLEVAIVGAIVLLIMGVGKRS